MTVKAESDSMRAAVLATDIRSQVRRSERRYQTFVLLLMAPSVLFVVAFFAWPIALFLFRSVDNPEVMKGLPTTCVALEAWSRRGTSPEDAYLALGHDLYALKGKPELAILARRLN